MYILMSIGSWAQEAIFTQVWSCDTRRIDFPLVDGLSTDTPGLGRHMVDVLTQHPKNKYY